MDVVEYCFTWYSVLKPGTVMGESEYVVGETCFVLFEAIFWPARSDGETAQLYIDGFRTSAGFASSITLRSRRCSNPVVPR